MVSKNVSDIIKTEDVKAWNKGDIVFISSGTGTGKSYFIRNKLTEIATEQWATILFIFNRTKLIDQNNELLYRENNFVITTTTYQEIEYEIMNKGEYDFSKYKYIVCDECHYFTEDSMFNDNSDVSMNTILNLNEHIRIFMSATGDTLFNYIKSRGYKKIWKYAQPRSFKHISSLSFYNKDSIELVEKFIDDKFSSPADKILWFCGSIKQAVELHEKYSDSSSFMCSKSDKNNKYQKYISEDTFLNENGKITFSSKYLFTTKVLDSGFDLIDPDIKLIVCDYFDINTVLQCIGRKRMTTSNDKINIVLRNYSNRSIGGFRSTTKQILDEADSFINGGVEEWLKIVGKFGRKANQIIMDNVSDKGKLTSDKKVSRPKYLKTISDFEIIKQILDENNELNKYREDNGEKKEDDGYMQYMMKELDQKSCYQLDNIYQKQGLDGYLESIAGKMLFKDEQKELINKMDVKANGRQIKSYTALNCILCEMELKYIIQSEKDIRRTLPNGDPNPNRQKTYWMVYRLTT